MGMDPPALDLAIFDRGAAFAAGGKLIEVGNRAP